MLVSGLTLGADFNDWSYAFTTGGWLNQFGYQNEALDKKFLPQLCNSRERWHGRKCAEYCDVAENCPYGRMVKRNREAAA